MPKDIFMPQLGMTMTEGKVVRWMKKIGDRVEKGEPVFEVETDKVVQEVNSLEEGTLTQILVGEGGTVPVGTIIAYLAAPGERAAGSGEQGEATVRAAAAGAQLPAVGAQDVGPKVPDAAGSGDFVRSSPAARKLAEKLGVDLRTVKGTGPAGRIVEEDVRQAAAAMTEAPAVPAPTPAEAAPAQAAPAVPPSPRPPVAPSPPGERVELRGIRKVVADRMAHSFSTAPHFYLTVEVDAGPLVALRGQVAGALQKKQGVEPTITDLLIKAVAMALREHPYANAAWADGAVQLNPEVNLGVAAAISDGLVVPVVRDADRLPLAEITRRRSALVEKARAGQLTLPDLEGGSFTVSNLGMFGIDQFQAIVNPPQAAILAVGRIKDRVVVVNGQPAVRPTMFATLSIDHRVMDGAVAAKFLARVVELLENPAEMLLDEGG